jgi:hypothetical protein
LNVRNHPIGYKMRRIGLLCCFFLLLGNRPLLGERILSPEEVLGFQVGADRKLADWSQIAGYFRELSRASDRVVLEELGETTEGKPFLMAIISDPANLKDLENFRQIQKRLADPRSLPEGPEGEIEAGKVVVLVTCSIHSTEIAAAQMSLEFAYEMATGSDPETREILNNVLFLLVPSLNPDGIDIVTRWYRQTLGTPAEGLGPPILYHRYAGHDNNRDWYMFTQKETRLAVGKIHNRWHPQIVLDLHQMGAYGARIFIPPFIDPIDPNVDPTLQAAIMQLGAAMASALVSEGKAGVLTAALFDAFTPARAYQHYHGGVRILTEAAGVRIATPLMLSEEDLVSAGRFDVHKPAWNFPLPWKGGQWRLRDIVEYEKTALRACLLHAARYRGWWLRNFHGVGLRALSRSSPYAFVIPAGQRDAQALRDLLEVLDFGLVEIHQAGEAFQAAGARLVSPPFGREGRLQFPAGSYVIPAAQPYGAFAKTLLELEPYPELREYEGGPLLRPYDVTAHNLGIQLGVEVYQVEAPFQASLQKTGRLAPIRPEVLGSGRFLVFGPENNAFARAANRLFSGGYSLARAERPFSVRGERFAAGTVLAVKGQEEDLAGLLEGLPLRVRRFAAKPQAKWRNMRLPRLGVYRSHAAVIDEGWTRWVLEQEGFPLQTLTDADVRERELASYDVIVIPAQEPERIKNGLSAPYPEEYRGGLGTQGLMRLKSYVEAGGTVVFLGSSCRLPIREWQLGVQERRELTQPPFYVPGSLLRVEVDNGHPLGYGVPEQSAVMFQASPLFNLGGNASVVRYARDPLLNGWAEGTEALHGRTALGEVKLGAGRVVLIGFRSQFRGQTRVSYKFLFNSLYYATFD